MITVTSGSTILDALHLNGCIRVLTDTLTDSRESIECLCELLHIGRKLGADRLEIQLDTYDAPFSEVEAWLIERGAVMDWTDGRMFVYVISTNG